MYVSTLNLNPEGEIIWWLTIQLRIHTQIQYRLQRIINVFHVMVSISSSAVVGILWCCRLYDTVVKNSFNQITNQSIRHLGIQAFSEPGVGIQARKHTTLHINTGRHVYASIPLPLVRITRECSSYISEKVLVSDFKISDFFESKIYHNLSFALCELCFCISHDHSSAPSVLIQRGCFTTSIYLLYNRHLLWYIRALITSFHPSPRKCWFLSTYVLKRS